MTNTFKIAMIPIILAQVSLLLFKGKIGLGLSFDLLFGTILITYCFVMSFYNPKKKPH